MQRKLSCRTTVTCFISKALLPASLASPLSHNCALSLSTAPLNPLPQKGLHPENRTKNSSVTIQGFCLHSSCRSSPRAISTGQLHTLLRFHLLPIKQVVFLCPYSMKDERSHLRGCFTLRCLQRLSRPYIATQLCPWQDNWCTRGTSIPVLSY